MKIPFLSRFFNRKERKHITETRRRHVAPAFQEITGFAEQGHKEFDFHINQMLNQVAQAFGGGLPPFPFEVESIILVECEQKVFACLFEVWGGSTKLRDIKPLTMDEYNEIKLQREQMEKEIVQQAEKN